MTMGKWHISEAIIFGRRLTSSHGLARISGFCRAKAQKAQCMGFFLLAFSGSSGVGSLPPTDALKADPSRAVSVDQVRAKLAAEHRAANSKR